MTSSTDAAGYVTSYTVNSRGLPTSVTTPDPDGTGPLVGRRDFVRLRQLRPPDDPHESRQHDAHIRHTTRPIMRTSETDELSHSASFVYDTLNRLTSQTDRVGAQTTFVYNGINLLTQQTDALGNVTDFEYNNRGFLTRKTYPDPDGAGPLARPYSAYSYDVGRTI